VNIKKNLQRKIDKKGNKIIKNRENLYKIQILRSSGIYAGRYLPKAASPKERKAGSAVGKP